MRLQHRHILRTHKSTHPPPVHAIVIACCPSSSLLHTLLLASSPVCVFVSKPSDRSPRRSFIIHPHPLLLLLLLCTQASVLQMEPPELYVRQNPTPNAYTLAISGHKPFIVVHTSLLELLSERELQAVLAHGGHTAECAYLSQQCY
jgi:Peptidase family M48